MAGLSGAQWAQIYAKAWLDPNFKQTLETNPTLAVDTIAQELNWELDCVFELPPQPDDVSSEELTQILAGEKLGYVDPPKCC